MFCWHCGTRLEPTDAFRAECGSRQPDRTMLEGLQQRMHATPSVPPATWTNTQSSPGTLRWSTMDPRDPMGAGAPTWMPPPPATVYAESPSSSMPFVWFALACCVASAVGSVGPWVNVPIFGSVNGTVGDGNLTLIASITAGGLVLGACIPTSRWGPLALVGFIEFLIGAHALRRLIDIFVLTSLGDELLPVNPGWGLLLMLLSGFAGAVFVLIAYRKHGGV